MLYCGIIKKQNIMTTLRPIDLIPLYFWNHEYRHYLRNVSESKQNKVLRLFISNNLNPSGTSKKHLEIIQLVTGLK